MSTVLLITDSLGQRRVERDDFPLALGGPGCAVVVDPSATAPLAWMGLNEDALFVQSASGGNLLHNGAPLHGSVWLNAGDVLTAGPVVLRLSNRDGERCLDVQDGGTGNITAPPVLDREALVSGTTEGAMEPVVSLKYQSARATAPA